MTVADLRKALKGVSGSREVTLVLLKRDTCKRVELHPDTAFDANGYFEIAKNTTESLDDSLYRTKGGKE